MISQVNSASLGYTPLSQAVKVESLPEANILPLSSARPINNSNSITNNSPSSSQSSIDTTDSEKAYPSKGSIQKNAEVQQVINQLKARDSEVKQHEMAHLSAAGGYSTGGMSFIYQMGPDGRKYAVGGEVGIDISSVAGDPQATLQKAMVVYGAALAPADPSAQDHKVASAATQMMAQARAEIVALSQEEQKAASEEKAQKDSVSEIDSESLQEEAGSVLKSPFSLLNRNGALLQNAPLIQNVNVSSSLENPDRSQFDLRMQFSVNNLLSTTR